MRRLVLFDIDGTILTSNGAAARAFRAALLRVFGTAGPRAGYSFAGRTDPQIATDLLTRAGIDAATIEAGLERVWSIYLELLAREFQRVQATVYPGVHALLDRLDAAPRVGVLGLLTGNVRSGARLKLEASGVGFQRFRVGAYGSDHPDRRELPAIALARAERDLGLRFEPGDAVIIGDTPHDIACGEHLGVRTIAVATGTYSSAQLAACGPHFLFDSLEHTDAVWEAIFS